VKLPYNTASIGGNAVLKKVLVANRGEIAIRVMSTCKRMGIQTVAVFSQGDRTAWHPQYADDAVEIGPAPAAQSYLNVERILEAAKSTGADSVHPGYGFLSENADFAEAVKDAGLTWIGPPTNSIHQMGDKLTAREIAGQSDVPLVPGSEVLNDPKQAEKIASEIGYPVLIKASAGGGGKGMRVVESEDELASAYERAQSEAQRSFGNPDVFLEKYVRNAKHIEVQVFSDVHGNHLWLGERECSIQRRHQKLVEESPSAAITEEQRKMMGEAAVALAQGCGYEGAGTVEFLYDADSGEFYFLEMNTRLQVEHPVTEMTTGLDLVEWQLLVAAGEKLPLTQAEIKRQGTAIECRIYAEDPIDFLPATGRLRAFHLSQEEGVRLDSGVRSGDVVGSFYDPLLAKFIAYGQDRQQAIEKAKQGLKNFAIAGVVTNVAYHLAVLDDPDFQTGKHLTNFVETHPKDLSIQPDEVAAIGKAAGHLIHEREEKLHTMLQASKDGWPDGRRV
jgi:propionyl-CoA carboxylase alpha chain